MRNLIRGVIGADRVDRALFSLKVLVADKRLSDEELRRIAVFTPIDYGAKGDGVTDDTMAFRRAIEANALAREVRRRRAER